jgi:hypothetical protein
MLLCGKGCAEVALAVGVARQTVYTLRISAHRGRRFRLNVDGISA